MNIVHRLSRYVYEVCITVGIPQLWHMVYGDASVRFFTFFFNLMHEMRLYVWFFFDHAFILTLLGFDLIACNDVQLKFQIQMSLNYAFYCGIKSNLNTTARDLLFAMYKQKCPSYGIDIMRNYILYKWKGNDCFEMYMQVIFVFEKNVNALWAKCPTSHLH